MKDKWLRWQTSTKHQFQIDRAYAEWKHLDQAAKAAKAKKEKKDKKKNKKKSKSEKAAAKKAKEEEAKKAEEEKQGLGETAAGEPVLKPTSDSTLLEGEDLEVEETEEEWAARNPNKFRLQIGDEKVVYELPDHSTGPSELYKKCWCKLMAIETIICSKYFSAKQAKQIIEGFPEEDGIRIEIMMVLFSRVVDVENFAKEIIDKSKTNKDRMEAVWRIGQLTLFNPREIDRHYEFDLSIWEDHELVKKLIQISLLEEGDRHICNVKYKR